MNFVKGFEKTAVSISYDGIKDAVMTAAGHAKDLGSGAIKGLKASGDVALKSHLNPMNAARDINRSVSANGGLSKTLKSQAGRRAFGKALGAAAPGIAATGAYGAAGVKAYKAVAGGGQQQQQQYYQ